MKIPAKKSYRNVSCLDIASLFGIEQAGNNSFHCFAHPDEHPSLVIYERRWKCEACGIGDYNGKYSNNVQLVREFWGCTTRQAIEIIELNFCYNSSSENSSKRWKESSKSEKYQIRFINRKLSGNERFRFFSPTDLDLRDPIEEDIEKIYQELGKSFSLKTLRVTGTKINQNEIGYGLVFRKGTLKYNPNNLPEYLYLEGRTDYLTGVEMGLHEHYGLVSIFNKMSLIELRAKENIIILDRDVFPQDSINGNGKIIHGIRSRVIAKTTCHVKFIRLPLEYEDLSDFYNKSNDLGDLIKIINYSPFEEVSAGLKQQESQRGFPSSEQKYFKLTEMGNADRFLRDFGLEVKFAIDSGDWLIYNGKRWQPDKRYKIYELMKTTVRKIPEEADGIEDTELRKKIRNWANRSESLPNVKNSLDFYKSGNTILSHELDKNPHLFNVVNGTIDLRTGKLQQHNPKDFISKIASIKFDPRATAPMWDKFLNQIFNDNRELIDFVQLAIGYSMTGETGEQCFFHAYGTGQNGKSTFFETISALMGEYFLKAGQDLLTSADRTRPQTIYDLPELPGKRFVVASEIEEGRHLAESRVKDLSGQDTIQARHLYQRPFWFKPVGKIWMYGNHKPFIRGTDRGIWRRFYIIPFDVVIPDDKVDKNLQRKLLTESSGILNWMLEGCRRWYRIGLVVPASIKNTVSEYRNELDIVQNFIDEWCITGSQCKSRLKILYTAFKKWCEENDIYLISKRRFVDKLKEKGFKVESGTGNVRSFMGIRISDEVIKMSWWQSESGSD